STSTLAARRASRHHPPPASPAPTARAAPLGTRSRAWATLRATARPGPSLGGFVAGPDLAATLRGRAVRSSQALLGLLRLGGHLGHLGREVLRDAAVDALAERVAHEALDLDLAGLGRHVLDQVRDLLVGLFHGDLVEQDDLGEPLGELALEDLLLAGCG